MDAYSSVETTVKDEGKIHQHTRRLATCSRESSLPGWSRPNQLLSHDRDGWSLEADKAAAKLVFIVHSCVSEPLQIALCRSPMQYKALEGHFLFGPSLPTGPSATTPSVSRPWAITELTLEKVSGVKE